MASGGEKFGMKRHSAQLVPFPSTRGPPLTTMQPRQYQEQNLNTVETNGRVTLRYGIKSFKKPACHLGIFKGQYLFTMRENQDNMQGKHVYTIVNLPSLNYFIDKLNISPEQVYKRYHPIGISVTNVESTNGANFRNENDLTINLGGVEYCVPSIFGNQRLDDGMNLYFIIKKIPKRLFDSYVLDGQGNVVSVEKEVSIKQKDGSMKMVNRNQITRVQPYACWGEPSMDILEYVDQDSSATEYAQYWKVGKVQRGSAHYSPTPFVPDRHPLSGKRRRLLPTSDVETSVVAAMLRPQIDVINRSAY